jgi:hypothetical protein
MASVALLGGSVEAFGAVRHVGTARAARVGREFKIKAGRTVTLKGEGLRLRFVRVAADSRCPEGVECVWAGNAEVLIEVGAKNGRRKSVLRLNTNASPERPAEVKYGRYTVKLVELSPYPREGRRLAAGAYTVTLLVVKD